MRVARREDHTQRSGEQLRRRGAGAAKQNRIGLFRPPGGKRFRRTLILAITRTKHGRSMERGIAARAPNGSSAVWGFLLDLRAPSAVERSRVVDWVRQP